LPHTCVMPYTAPIMYTRIERERIVPKFISREHFFWWMNRWYYPSDHWQETRRLVTAVGRCKICGKGRKKGDPFQAHHAKGAYEYLWREQEALHLMECLHSSCHMDYHRKQRGRKALTFWARKRRR
jgi:hypothetical protein